MTISGDGDGEYQPIEFLLPLYPGEIWYEAGVWKRKGKRLVDEFATAVATHMPKVVESARRLHADGWRLRMTICGIGCKPPRRVERTIGDHFVDEEDPWEPYFWSLDLPLHPANCFHAPRGLPEIHDACGEALDRVWYSRSVNRMIATGSGPNDRVPPPDIVSGILTSQMRVEAKYGREDLEEAAEEPWENGLVNGKLSSLRWIMGEPWDSLYT